MRVGARCCAGDLAGANAKPVSVAGLGARMGSSNGLLLGGGG